MGYKSTMQRRHYQLGNRLIAVDATSRDGSEHIRVLERENLTEAKPIPGYYYDARMFDSDKVCEWYSQESSCKDTH